MKKVSCIRFMSYEPGIGAIHGCRPRDLIKPNKRRMNNHMLYEITRKLGLVGVATGLALAIAACGGAAAPEYQTLSKSDFTHGDSIPAPTEQVILTFSDLAVCLRYSRRLTMVSTPTMLTALRFIKGLD